MKPYEYPPTMSSAYEMQAPFASEASRALQGPSQRPCQAVPGRPRPPQAVPGHSTDSRSPRDIKST